jgi:hypothetical protein
VQENIGFLDGGGFDCLVLEVLSKTNCTACG